MWTGPGLAPGPGERAAFIGSAGDVTHQEQALATLGCTENLFGVSPQT